MSDTVDTMQTHAEGNTKLRRRSRAYCFTVNNYSQKEYDTLILTLQTKKADYIIGKEKGSQGTPHLQGYARFKNAIEWDSFKRIVPRGHVEPAKGKPQANYDYCSKENDFQTNMRLSKKRAVMLKERIIEPKGWQLNVLNLLLNPTERKINWIVDTIGQKGKNTLIEYILKEYQRVIYFTGGAANDICSQILLCDEDEPPEICIWNFTRSKEGFISYDAIEQVKDGLVNSSKYKGGFKHFPRPHVLIFANFHPKRQALSEDRWNIIDLENESQIEIKH